MSGANFPSILVKSRSTYLICPCEKSCGSRPVPRAAGLLNTAPQVTGCSRRQRISTTSPGSASLTAIGPMIECGPRPGLLVRNSTRRPIGTPGCNSFMKCDQVFGKLTQSPDSIVTIGGKVASKTPSRTVSRFDSTTWTRPLPLVAPAAGEVLPPAACANLPRSEEHTSELQSQFHLVCRLLLEKKKKHPFPLISLQKKKHKKNNKYN